jgi:hypothetical protein
VGFATIILCVSSQRVFIVVFVSLSTQSETFGYTLVFPVLVMDLVHIFIFIYEGRLKS